MEAGQTNNDDVPTLEYYHGFGRIVALWFVPHLNPVLAISAYRSRLRLAAAVHGFAVESSTK